MLLFPSDDEVGALQGAIRVQRAQRAEQSNSGREGMCFLFPSDDEVGALQGAIRVERAQRAEQSTEPWANVGPRSRAKAER